MKIEVKKKKKLLERSCAQFMLVKPEEEKGEGVVGKADKKSASKGKKNINASLILLLLLFRDSPTKRKFLPDRGGFHRSLQGC